ncbi:MAG: hypothetical protein WC360_07030, partial [Opitutales bacterium]
MKGYQNSETFEKLCVRYLSGEADAEERRILVESLNDESLRELFESLQKAWNSFQSDPRTRFDSDAALER